MYGILINGKLQAFHKDKNVVNTYADMYATSNPKDMIEIVKFKKRAINGNRIPTFQDYYLEECKDGIYIQRKYVETYEWITSGLSPLDPSIDDLISIILQKEPMKGRVISSDIRCINSALQKIEEEIASGTKTKKEVRTLLEVSKILEKHRKKLIWIPSLEILRDDYWRLEEYRSKVNYDM